LGQRGPFECDELQRYRPVDGRGAIDDRAGRNHQDRQIDRSRAHGAKRDGDRAGDRPQRADERPYITSKVKTRLLEDEKLKALYVKVVTERGVVYLMGIMSREEGTQAAQVAATTAGVARVVKVFEYKN
jgi:osmotically-inducible protein OsmY